MRGNPEVGNIRGMPEERPLNRGYYEQPFERRNVVCSSDLQAAFNASCTGSASCRKRF